MVIQVKNYVSEDAHGALRVGQSDVSLDSIVIAYQEGLIAEAIQEQYPALSLEQVYGGIAFYLANKDEVDRYLKLQEQRWDELRQTVSKNPGLVVERLRSMRQRS